ncbi:hypothetical protein HBB16_20210 [Pseudonocardia sp. MCCB 268]|nr:hypothetical protein [Pseudonocardia cytotoxica]
MSVISARRTTTPPVIGATLRGGGRPAHLASRVVWFVAAQDRAGRSTSRLRGPDRGRVHHGRLRLVEELIRRGRPAAQRGLRGYRVLMAPDMPRDRADPRRAPGPDGGPLGSKGLGTGVILPSPPPLATRSGTRPASARPGCRSPRPGCSTCSPPPDTP